MEHIEPVEVKENLTELDLEGIDKIAEDAVDFINSGKMDVRAASRWAIHSLEDEWGFPSITALYHKMVERLESNFQAKRELVRYVQMW
ncbi:MAG: hypothetical protein C4B59_08525 [Candidatus Methanogaster sp.]|uniref:Uncharacterized protein n=1 Tax=Candidatus Methanogaster sp. TaxID=3386292 RepID=A0AC61L2H0_9EURY|nr:MAG: hypothetical protein C4B59_08525 [ANME-2 cluster archaeon]